MEKKINELENIKRICSYRECENEVVGVSYKKFCSVDCRNKESYIKNYPKKNKTYNGFWTYDECQKVAQQYTTKSGLQNDYPGAYQSIVKHNWELMLNYEEKIKPKNYWTYERCAEIALKFFNKRDLRKNNGTVYQKITKNSWDELTKHMIALGNRYNKLCYVFEFSYNHCYVGITGDEDRRKKQHLQENNSSVYEHIIKTGLIPNMVIISEYILIDDVILLEETTKIEYENNGWIILNKAKTGNIGGNVTKYNFDSCLTEAMNYDNKHDFIINNKNIYLFLIKNDFLTKLYDTLGWSKRKKDYWTYDICEQIASIYNKKADFRKYDRNCYDSAYLNNWLDSITKHMSKRHINGYWTFEKCQKEAKTHKNITQFMENSKGAYTASKRNNWLNEFFPKKIKNTL